MGKWSFRVIGPVAEFLNTLSGYDLAKIRNIFRLFEEYGPILPTKYMKRISGTRELWELRARRIRIFFFINNKSGIGVHGMVKKSQKIPKQDINTAVNRARLIKEQLL